MGILDLLVRAGVSAALLTAALLATPSTVRADGPGPDGYGDLDAFGLEESRTVRRYGPGHAAAPGRPQRRVMGGPDYVGSSFGLGKPAYYGIGPRPDWGRSSVD